MAPQWRCRGREAQPLAHIELSCCGGGGGGMASLHGRGGGIVLSGCCPRIYSSGGAAVGFAA